MKRITRDGMFAEVVLTIAKRCTCPRPEEIMGRVGAILVQQGRIISTGYAGSPKGLDHCQDAGCSMLDGHCVRTIHGEHNAILQAATVSGTNTQGSTMYTKYSPCIHCTKYIIAAGIKKVVMGKVYRNSKVVDFLKQAGIEVEVYQENKEWQEQLQEIFGSEIEVMKPDEGDVEMKTNK